MNWVIWGLATSDRWFNFHGYGFSNRHNTARLHEPFWTCWLTLQHFESIKVNFGSCDVQFTSTSNSLIMACIWSLTSFSLYHAIASTCMRDLYHVICMPVTMETITMDAQSVLSAFASKVYILLWARMENCHNYHS